MDAKLILINFPRFNEKPFPSYYWELLQIGMTEQKENTLGKNF